MKNLITYLKTLWSWGANSQSSDVSHDCRLTVGSPSGSDAKLQVNSFMRFAVVLTLIFTLGVGNAWGALPANPTWTATALDDIADDATIIIISSSGYALPSTTTSSSPAKISCTVTTSAGVSTISPASGKLQSLAWTVDKLASSWKFYQEGSNSVRLYLTGTSSNTALRVGDANSANDEFVMGDGGKLLKVTTASRYVGPYNSGSDWRTYNSETASNYNKASLTFYVLNTGGGSTPSVTPDPKSLDWGNVLQSSSQSTKTFDISGSNLTGNLSVVVTGGYSVSCGSSISVTSGTPNVTTITVTPPSTSTAGAKNGKVTISGGGLASNVEVNLSMTVNAASTVTWMNNGSEYTTTLVANGSKPEFPINPSSCDGTSTTFYGWSTSEWSGKLDDVSAKTIYTSGSEMPNVSGPVTYHAVFAKETSTLTPVPDTWTRITSTSQLTDGATVMLVHYSKYAINNTPGATSCTANAEITNSNAALRWIAVKSGSKWKFKTSAGKYLSTSATTNNTTLSLNQTNDEWTISADAGGYSNCFNLNNGNDLEYFNKTFKLYKWSLNYKSAYPFYIYIQKTTGSTTYSQYLTTCCTNNVPAPTVIATNTAYTVTLTWGAVDGATGYEVSWNGGAFEAATSPCVKSGLTASTDYIYKVRATYDPLVKCGALVASGNVTTDDVYSVTYSGGTGTGSCSPSGSVAPVSYEAGATVTLAPTNSFSMTSNRFAAWVVKDADDNVIPVSNNQFTMPAKNVTVTATWTAVQDKYYDRMHQSTDASHGGIADGNGKYYIVREGCNYTVPSPADDSTGDTDCHTTHFKLLGWIAQSHLKSDGSGEIKPGAERYIFQGGGTKSATGATYYAIWAIMTE